MISIDFEFMSQYGPFRDALCLPDDHGFSDAELEEMKNQRFSNWIAFIEEAHSQPVGDINSIGGSTSSINTPFAGG